MDSAVINNINEIGFLMNYQTGKTIKEQKIFDVYNENFINEAPVPGAKPQQTQQKPGQQQGQQQKLTPEQMAAAKAKVQAQSKKTAEAIFQELKKAMDKDGDNVLNDYDGTNEKGVVDAIKKINNKEILDYLNQRVKQTKQYGSLKAWINDELSDFDSEYGQIWKKLESLGYAGANYSILLKYAGVAATVTGVRAGMDFAEGIAEIFKDPVAGFKKIIDAVRSFLGGVVGGVITTLLDFTGIGKVVTSIGWGILLVGDVIISALEGVVRWPEIILGIVTIATTGAIGASVGKVLKPLMGKGGTIGDIIQKMTKFSWFKSLSAWVSKGVSKISGLVQKAITWITSQGWWKKYMVNSFVGKSISGAMTKINEYLTSFTQSLAKASGAGTKYSASVTGQKLKQKAIEKGAKDIKTKLTTDFGKEMGQESLRTVVGDVGGDKAQKVLDVVKAGTSLKKDFGSLAKTNKKVGVSGYSTVGPTTGKLAKQTGAVVKDTVKLGQKTSKIVPTTPTEPQNKTQQQPKKQQVQMTENVLEEIREIKRYMNLIL